jgi:hypothetical protein
VRQTLGQVQCEACGLTSRPPTATVGGTTSSATTATRSASPGSCRHAHPVRTTYKIASTIARHGCFSGRPPVLTGGSSGSITAHCSSQVSDGYRRGRCVIGRLLITSARRLRRRAAPSQTRSQTTEGARNEV